MRQNIDPSTAGQIKVLPEQHQKVRTWNHLKLLLFTSIYNSVSDLLVFSLTRSKGRELSTHPFTAAK